MHLGQYCIVTGVERLKLCRVGRDGNREERIGVGGEVWEGGGIPVARLFSTGR